MSKIEIDEETGMLHVEIMCMPKKEFCDKLLEEIKLEVAKLSRCLGDDRLEQAMLNWKGDPED